MIRELSDSQDPTRRCPKCGEQVLFFEPVPAVTVLVLVFFLGWAVVGLLSFFVFPGPSVLFAAWLVLWFWFRGPWFGVSGWAECPSCRWFLLGSRERPKLRRLRGRGHRLFRWMPLACVIPALFYLGVAVFPQDGRFDSAFLNAAILGFASLFSWMGGWAFHADPRSYM